MKTTILLLAALATILLSSCAEFQMPKMKPVKLTYTDPSTGLSISENVGDGTFGLEVDLTKPIDLGGGRTIDVVIVEPAK